MIPTPGLTLAQIERLACLGEELGEAQQIVGKILRHGYYSKHPDGGPTNLVLLEMELGDILAIVKLLRVDDMLSMAEINRYTTAKLDKLPKYTHWQDAAIFEEAKDL